MKKNSLSRKFVFILISFSILIFSCQDHTMKSAATKDNGETVDSWYSDQHWLNGLKLTPHESINQEEFSRQYRLKKAWWDEAFTFMKTHDLKTLALGKYIIDSGNVFATVWEGVPRIKDSVLWEAHRNFNDLQYIIHGKAEMGITPIDDPNLKITVPYSKEEDIEHFIVSAGDQYYLADSSTFFIFSSKEIHRLAIHIDGES